MKKLTIVFIAALILLAGVLLGITWYGSSDYESCVDSAARHSESEKKFDALVANCGARFLSRRNTEGPGYIYIDAQTSIRVETVGPNPNQEEWASINEKISEYLAEKKLREQVEAEQAAARAAAYKKKMDERRAEQERIAAHRKAELKVQRERCEGKRADALRERDRLIREIKKAENLVKLLPFDWKDVSYRNRRLRSMGWPDSKPTQDLRIVNESRLDILGIEIEYQWIFQNQVYVDKEPRPDFKCPSALSSKKYFPLLRSSDSVLLRSGETLLRRLDDGVIEGSVVFACARLGKIKFASPLDTHSIPACEN